MSSKHHGESRSLVARVRRMLGTRDVAAYAALTRSAGQLVAMPNDRPWERFDEPLGWMDNVAAWFPRSPLTAMRRLGRNPGNRPVSLHSLSGNTRHLSDPNDAFFARNRWLGGRRNHRLVTV